MSYGIAPRLGAARWRLTLLYSALFAFGGVVLLVVVNLMARDALPDALAQRMVVFTGPTGAGVISGIVMPEHAIRVPDSLLQELTIGEAAAIASHEYLRWSAIVLVGLLLLSAAAGYLLSGRVLAPIQAAFDSEARLVATVSHELRTPLATQRAVLETSTTADDPAVQQAISQNRRATEIIQAMLTLARASRGSAEVKLIGIDLAVVVREQAEALQAELDTMRVRLRVRLGSALTIRGDRVLLERLVANLLQNAIRHNIAGGTADIWVRRNAGTIVVTVSNTGPLIAAADVDTLVQPFRRGGADRTGSARSTGLGLTIAAEIATFHGGTLRLQANPDGGLTAVARLPLAR